MDTANGRAEQQGHMGRFAQGTMLQVEEHSCVVQRFLAAGGQADVYLVTMLSDGTPWVLKYTALGSDEDSGTRRQQMEHEIGIMRLLTGHPQIVALKAAEVTATAAYILMEYCTSDVVTLMNQTLPNHLPEETILHIFSDACKAVAHLHYQNPPLLHRDIKVENMLATSRGYKLCDFGSATSHLVAPNTRLQRAQIMELDEDIQRMTTLEYRAPEMVDLYLQRGVTEQADIWALGVLLYKLCYLRTPFDNATPLMILNAEYSVPETPRYSRQLRHVFQMTMREEPRERSNIYTLCTYVCGLRGETCLLENRYEEPAREGRQGLGWVSAVPPHKQPQQPRRYAASAKAAVAEAEGMGLDGDAIVPMRRGRPQRAAAGSSAASPGSSRAASPARRTTQAFGPRFGSPPVSTAFPPTAFHAPLSAPAAPQKQQQPPPSSADGLGIFDDDPDSAFSAVAAAAAADPVNTGSLSAGTRRVRMSVRAPDGRESLSADFVQGAVFGSARRASVLRRQPSGTAGSRSPVSRTSSGSRSLASRVASLDGDIEEDGLPGFVCRPLPPPPPPPPARSPPADVAGLASPESLADADADPWALPPKDNDDDDENSALRLSTILEACQADRVAKTAATAAANHPSSLAYEDDENEAPLTREQRVRSIYAVTLDKLDDARLSMSFDDPFLFSAKAQYAAQRGSIYQANIGSGSAAEKMHEEARRMWGEIPGNVASDLLGGSSFSSSSRRGPLPSSRRAMDEDAWTVGAVPPASAQAQAQTQAQAQGSVDVDKVLRRAGERNRKLLVAQNNRRSLYIASGQSGSHLAGDAPLPPLLPEDVDDNMRVLSEVEIEQLLERMDAYNRELLSEQERWGREAAAQKREEEQEQEQQEEERQGDMAVIEGIIAEANVQLLREEQAGGLLQGVLAKAKSTFAKGGAKLAGEPAAAAAAEEPTKAAELAPVSEPIRAAEVTPVAKPTETVEVAKPTQPEAPAKAAEPAPLAVEPAPPVTYAAPPPLPPTQPVVPPAKPPRAFPQAEPSPSPSTPPRPTTAPAQPTTTAQPTPSSAEAVPKLPAMPRARTDVAPPPLAQNSPAGDPLAEARMRLKKKQSSPALGTASTAVKGNGVSARAAFLDAARPAMPKPVTAGAGAPGKKPVKSVRNLVAMFEQS
ncbi:Ark- serine/threonine protein kinase [Coemansia erecta]|uniref:non-specific serine/threonine protein kinase n=1 Tax=Coemansia erecta TaxID=147472 RepID=A0A9W7Y4W2_9FUNG|nr:Ark- serine/threonine protein kinase [Coemansia erecta]